MAGLSNKDVARVFREIELLSKILGRDARRAMTYGRISRLIEGLPKPAVDLAAAGRLIDVKGIGASAASVVADLLDRGSSQRLEELRAELPPGLPDILRVPGLGPKRIHTVLTELGVTSVEELRACAVDGRLAALPGFGPKMAEKVIEGVAFLDEIRARRRTADAWATANECIQEHGLQKATIAGAVRRGCLVVDAIAIVAIGSADGVSIRGATRDGDVWVRPRGHEPELRIRFTTEPNYARALFEETGPADHVAAVLALPGADDTEDAIYESRGLHAVPPERRHACDGKEPVPELVTRRDLRGLVHAHTTWSDGRLSIEEMADAAAERGYSYLTVTDHSKTAVYARGLPDARLQEQIEAIRAYNAKGGPVRVLASTEADILPDGTIDYPDALLRQLDFVIASVHSSFGQDRATTTARLVAAVRHPHVHVLGHATGRLLLRRPGYDVDMDAVMEAAAQHGTAIELNANPWRLDLDPSLHERAQALGIGVPIGPDAHSAEGMDDNDWGVLAARHGGLRKQDVPNTLDADGFLNAVRS